LVEVDLDTNCWEKEIYGPILDYTTNLVSIGMPSRLYQRVEGLEVDVEIELELPVRVNRVYGCGDEIILDCLDDCQTFVLDIEFKQNKESPLACTGNTEYFRAT
jgi:hypothetical protein